jgi:predicted enzyme related to lactoylglutathione lyase
MVKDMAFVAYAVSDVPRALRFYQDVVGLQPGESFGDHFVEFTVGRTTFAIDGEPPGIVPGTCSGANFEVDDIAASRAALVERGVPVSDVHESPVCYFAFVTDPDGNGFGIHQRKS